MVLPLLKTGPHDWGEFMTLPDDDRRELVDGWFVEDEVPTYLHEHVVAELVFYLKLWAREHGGGVTSSAFKVKVHDQRGFMPDVQYYAPGNVPAPEALALEDGRPDLVVEVISPSSGRYDRILKLQAYARKGIPEYWIVDPERRELERYLLDPHGLYALPEVCAEEAVFTPASFEGLEIPLARLWAVETPAPE